MSIYNLIILYDQETVVVCTEDSYYLVAVRTTCGQLAIVVFIQFVLQLKLTISADLPYAS